MPRRKAVARPLQLLSDLRVRERRPAWLLPHDSQGPLGRIDQWYVETLRAMLRSSKLLQIRQSLGCSQRELVKRMGMEDQIHYTNISKYELDKNEPPLGILLAYARLTEIPVEYLIDDKLDLPL
jgi:DNA-binding XRE family transcriptional regulator